MIRLRNTPLACIVPSLSLCLLAGPGLASAEDLTIERLHAEPALAGPALREAQVSPDGRRVTILRGRPDDAEQLDIWTYDTATGEGVRLVSSTDLVDDAPLSEEEKNRRERQRIYERGIVDYDWDEKGAALLFSLGGDVFIYDFNAGGTRRVTRTAGFETDPKTSPAGGYVSYVRADELYVYDLSAGRETQVTQGAGGTVRNAVAEFVAQEELDRDTGYWWSPDDRAIAFTQIDEAPVAVAERLDFGPEGATSVRQRYPFAGTDNVTVRLGVVGPGGGAARYVDLGKEADVYLADVHWARDGSALYVQRLSRDQKRLDLLKADPATGRSKVVLTETSDTWVNLNKSFRPLADGGFVWGSERSGFHHLYRYGPDGESVGAVTAGDWPVSQLECVDEKKGVVYFTGFADGALERRLYRAPLSSVDGEVSPERIMAGGGWRAASFSKDCSAYIGEFSATDQPPQAAVYRNDGARLFWLSENALGPDHPYTPYLSSHVAPSFGVLEGPDGASLDYMLLTPPNLRKGEQAPAVVLVYGGPHAQTVKNAWTKSTPFEQLLVDRGYVVFRLDNRGAANRGKAFEDHLYQKMGGPEAEDQAAGVRWLGGRDFVDASRIGVFGWSYGGYMTLMMLAKHGDLFAAGVSGAPVTDWRLYDTAYTERYMGDPRTAGAAYEESAVFSHLDGLSGEGELLLLHGMADDNVVFQHSVKLMDALQKSGKDFELMTFPSEKHGFRAKSNRLYRDRMIVDFFDRKLRAK